MDFTQNFLRYQFRVWFQEKKNQKREMGSEQNTKDECQNETSPKNQWGVQKGQVAAAWYGDPKGQPNTQRMGQLFQNRKLR